MTFSISFLFSNTTTTEIYTLSLHDALPIWPACKNSALKPPPHRTPPSGVPMHRRRCRAAALALGLAAGLLVPTTVRSEEHTSELQSHVNLVCRLLLEKKK